MTLTTARLTPQEWETLRDLRLAGLAESPDAFRATWVEECVWGQDEWQHFFETVAWFVARRGHVPCGVVGSVHRREDPDQREVIGMWVTPVERGHRVGARLLDAVVSVARAEGAHLLVLGVTVGNVPAKTLYATYGFTSTGAILERSRERGGAEELMRLPL